MPSRQCNTTYCSETSLLKEALLGAMYQCCNSVLQLFRSLMHDLQMDDVLKELGPKENPNKDSSMRLIPPAKVVGEGTPPPACAPRRSHCMGLAWLQ